MKLIVLSLLTALTLSAQPLFAKAKTMYVKSSNVSLKSSNKSSAKVLTKLSRGTSVSVLTKKGRWYEVKTKGKTGWIYKYKLSTKKPSKGSALAGLGGGGASAREGSSAASIRGLSPTSEKYAGRANIGREHVAMVKHMEQVRVSKATVEGFLKAGKLGEYGQ